jgi:hypothetical protein
MAFRSIISNINLVLTNNWGDSVQFCHATKKKIS